MAIDEEIRDKNLQCVIHRAATEIPGSLSSEIYKYEYWTGEKISPPKQHKNIEEAKFTHLPIRKAFEKNKKYWGASKKQVKALQSLVLTNKTTELILL